MAAQLPSSDPSEPPDSARRQRVKVEIVGDLETIPDPYAAAEWVDRLEADPRAMRRWGGVEVRHARLILTVLGSRPRPSSVRPIARTREQRPKRHTRTRGSSRAGPDSDSDEPPDLRRLLEQLERVIEAIADGDLDYAHAVAVDLLEALDQERAA
jgi:hypothetical protein